MLTPKKSGFANFREAALPSSRFENITPIPVEIRSNALTV
jgi:hypothetical protein